MKKIIVSLVALTTITISAQAQTQRKPVTGVQDSTQKNHVKGQHKQMAEKLQFTDDQKQQMKAINIDVKNKMTILNNSNLSTKEFKVKKEELLKERKQKITALLTPEQKEKLKEFKREHHGKGKMDVAKRMEKMKERLALSNDQVAKIEAQRKEFIAKFETIKNNQALSMDDKKAQMKTIREERKNSFRSILTPGQLKKMEDIKQKRAGKAA